jgi:hypothetical protein
MIGPSMNTTFFELDVMIAFLESKLCGSVCMPDLKYI